METVESVDCREIPEDLQTEILSWLPPNSLAICNCVCQYWNHSIPGAAFLLRHSHSPACSHFYIFFTYFITHTLNNLRTLQLFSFKLPKNNNDSNNDKPITKGIRVPVPTLPDTLLSEYFTVSNFCDDLVCFFDNDVDFHHNLSVLLYSVRINSFFVLPGKRESCYDGIWHSCSIGFDPIQKEYRVLRCISRRSDINMYQYRWCSGYDILTIGSKSWKPIDHDHVPSSLSQGRPINTGGSFCLNGVIYWIHDHGVWTGGNGDECLFIASFDLGCEEFRAFRVDQLVGTSYSFKQEYCLMPLKGSPTLFFWEKFDDEVLQQTLSDHPNGVWGRRIVTSHVLTSIWAFYVYVGGSIALKSVDSTDLSYCCYDLENGADWLIEIEDEPEGIYQVLRIGSVQH